ncbi:hypothetical protein CBR_g21749 [Chara braunii]|uniref:F-box domain-containing protein n=1 Tax=Chara braunii TaxID=69332 RepID=A0A388L1B8_CHABU|nr:hypothetical protein CBR_g21749 [Chara braunii]|eukprot:GBG76089.1 hypothetical protein CBR_g21749 [Chara braunii]
MRDFNNNSGQRNCESNEVSPNERIAMVEDEGGKDQTVKSLSSLPAEILTTVISLLSVQDVCALSCCSRFWRAVCSGDEVWIQLYSRQWPLAEVDSNSCFLTGGTDKKGRRDLRGASPSSSSSSSFHSASSSASSSSSSRSYRAGSSSSVASSCSSIGSVDGRRGGAGGGHGGGDSWGASSYGGGRTRGSATRGEVSSAESIAVVSSRHDLERRGFVAGCGQGSWRLAYMTQRIGVAEKARRAMNILREHSVRESVEIGDYRRALAELHGFISFNDVVEHLLKERHSVLVNLLGLHFAVLHLGVSVDDVLRALKRGGVANRKVCVRLWSIGGLVMGYRRRDEMQVINKQLADCCNDVVHILERGAMHEVRRIQISADFQSSAWVGREHHWQR